MDDKHKRLIGTIGFNHTERELAAMILARMLYVANPDIDEDEASQLIEEFLGEHELDLVNCAELAVQIVKMTTFNEKFDVWN